MRDSVSPQAGGSWGVGLRGSRFPPYPDINQNPQSQEVQDLEQTQETEAQEQA